MIEYGSFDTAAARLHVTPSAISQRIKALEQRVGQVIVVREKPCKPTAAGVPRLRLAAQTAMLESEALAEMSGGGSPEGTRIAIAVNADSMATWFTGVFSALDGVPFDVRIESAASYREPVDAPRCAPSLVSDPCQQTPAGSLTSFEGRQPFT